MIYDTLQLTEVEREILYYNEVISRTASYGTNIGPLKIEVLINEKGLWAYRIYTHKETSYNTSPGIIESKYKFPYDGKAHSAAKNMVDLYWMACNAND